MRKQFGQSVWKVSVDAGFTCPNIDGTVATDGCLFCNAKSFAPSRRHEKTLSIPEQIDEGIRQLKRRYKAEKFLAYFQPSTNTHAPVQHLETVYREAMRHSDIVGLAIGTRPDVLGDDVLDLLQRLSKETWLQLEIGMQSTHDKTLAFLRRGHDYQTFVEAWQRAKERQLRLGVHLILGVPGENRDDIQSTANEVARLLPDTVKIHNLYVVKNTPLATLWEAGQIVLPTLEEYAEMVADFLERIPPQIVIDRISGESDDTFLRAPDWAKIKHAARNAIDAELRKRNGFQGKHT